LQRNGRGSQSGSQREPNSGRESRSSSLSLLRSNTFALDSAVESLSDEDEDDGEDADDDGNEEDDEPADERVVTGNVHRMMLRIQPMSISVSALSALSGSDSTESAAAECPRRSAWASRPGAGPESWKSSGCISGIVVSDESVVLNLGAAPSASCTASSDGLQETAN